MDTIEENTEYLKIKRGKEFIKTKTKCVVTCLPNFEWCTWPSLNA